ncbi:MAG TPA: DinB family protein [Ktedonobacterales bacterium]|nr:DinB family protein [Ktedonobacterales bacterium]
MADQDPLLTGILDGWRRYNDLLADALSPLSDEQLDLRIAQHLRSIRELATHLVGVRAGWFHRGLGEGGEEIAAIAQWQQTEQPPRSASELVAGLGTTWRLIEDAVTRWTPEQLAEQIEVERYGRRSTLTRPWVTWHVLEHDLHHGGELGYSLGMHNLAAPGV